MLVILLVLCIILLQGMQKDTFSDKWFKIYLTAEQYHQFLLQENV